MKVLFTAEGAQFLNIHIRPSMRRHPRKNPSTGDIRSARRTFITPDLIITPVPEVAIAAPTRLESIAWLEDVGSPKYQVRRSHRIAEQRAEATVSCVILAVCTSPAPTVFATAVPDRAPRRFRTAAMPTAARGESTRVETEVAIAFAVSWKPFMKSKMTARTITARRREKESCMLEDYGLEDVCHVLAPVGGIFQQLVYLFPFYYL